MKNEFDGATGCLLAIALWAVIIAVFFLQGFYLMLAWGWVVVPIFKLPALTYWGATGLSVMWSVLFQTNIKTSDDGIETLKHDVTVLAVDTLAMVVLWLVSLGI